MKNRAFLKAVWAVGVALGHAWPRVTELDQFIALAEAEGDLDRLAEAIRARTESLLHPTDPARYTAPRFEGGRYRHISGGGRYSVGIAPIDDGAWSMEVRVRRPGGDAIRLYASGDEAGADWLAEPGEAPVLPRHVEAARELMGSFGEAYGAPQNTERADQVLAELEQGARERALQEGLTLLERATQALIEAGGVELATRKLEQVRADLLRWAEIRGE